MESMEPVLTLRHLKFNPPCLPLERVQDYVQTHYGFAGEFRLLEGERDQNFRIATAGGGKYVLKISAVDEDPAAVDFQVRALLHIERTDPSMPVPRIVRGKSGAVCYRVPGPEGHHLLRMLTYLPGMPYQNGPEPSPSGLHRVGEFLARLSRALHGYAHPAAENFMPWDNTNMLVFNSQLLELLADDVRILIGPALQRLRHEIYPRLPALRSQVIHQDGHGANLLRAANGGEDVVGIIDFGDMVHGPVICDLAVSLADFIEPPADPLARAAAMCRGFHSVIPLGTEDISMLLDLIIARQIRILQLFEFRRREMQRPPSFVTSDQPAVLASLKSLICLDPAAFNKGIKKALN